MIKNAPIWVRSIAVAMLFAMTYYFAGYRIVYFMLTKDAKSYASVEMKKKNVVLEKLQFDKTEYSKVKWTEGNKEFSYNGQLYDVVSVSNTNGIYSVQAYSDKNETQWVKALNDFVKQLFPANNSKSNKNVESVISAFQNEYLPLNTIKVMSPDVTYTAHFSHNIKVASLCTDTSIWHPPIFC